MNLLNLLISGNVIISTISKTLRRVMVGAKGAGMDGVTISSIIGAIIFCLIGSTCFCIMYVEHSIKEFKEEVERLKKEKSQSEDCDL